MIYGGSGYWAPGLPLQPLPQEDQLSRVRLQRGHPTRRLLLFIGKEPSTYMAFTTSDIALLTIAVTVVLIWLFGIDVI